MANPSIVQGDMRVLGNLSSTSLSVPSGSINDAAIAAGSAGTNISSDKVRHQFSLELNQDTGTATTAQTRIVHIARGPGVIVGVSAVADVAPTGGDKAATVDVKKSTAGGAFASILSAVVTLNSSSTSKVVQAGSLSVTSFVAGDLLEIVIAISGSTGSQGQGVCATVMIAEDPNP